LFPHTWFRISPLPRRNTTTTTTTATTTSKNGYGLSLPDPKHAPVF
jgi:hypothetical protein